MKIAAHLKAGTPVIVEGKIKPETYTADGVEHKTFSIKADYIRKIGHWWQQRADLGCRAATQLHEGAVGPMAGALRGVPAEWGERDNGIIVGSVAGKVFSPSKKGSCCSFCSFRNKYYLDATDSRM